jgi:hypothetical protein
MKTVIRFGLVSTALSAVGAVVACGSGPVAGPERTAATSAALNVCTPACTADWSDCWGLTVKGTTSYFCSDCGYAGGPPCDASGPIQGCMAQPTTIVAGTGEVAPNMGLGAGILPGLCTSCGDYNQPACEASWQPPYATVPWVNGCNATSSLVWGQPLQASGGTCIGCGLPGQPVCSCPPSTPGCTVPASVEVQGFTVGTIPPGFIGLSYEKDVLGQGLFKSSNAPLIALFNLLGPGVLRIGAGGADGVDAQAPWVAPTPPADDPLADLAGFLELTPGWTVLYGLPMLTGCAIQEPSPHPAPQAPPHTYCPLATQLAVGNEAAAAAMALGTSLYGFEIGQEPEGYVYTNAYGSGLPGFANPQDYDSSTSTYNIDATTYAYYLAQWQKLYTAVHQAASGVAITGPAASAGVNGVNIYATPFAKDAATEINLLTQHYYLDGARSLDCGRAGLVDGEAPPAWTTGANSPPQTTPATWTCSGMLDKLLHPDPNLTTSGTGMLALLQQAASMNKISRGYRLAEANSFEQGGIAGISDSQAAALWVIDFLFANAIGGSAGVNLHGGGFSDGYTPIADHKDGVVCDTGSVGDCHLSKDPSTPPADPAVRPDYYGLLLFSMAGQGSVSQPTVTGTAVNITAYAVGLADGSTNVVLVNKDPTKTVQANVIVGAATTGSLTLFTGAGPSQSLTATTGFTLGGAEIVPGMPWTPSSTSVTLSAVDVPPASAALVKVPRPKVIGCKTPMQCCIQAGGSWDGKTCE